MVKTRCSTYSYSKKLITKTEQINSNLELVPFGKLLKPKGIKGEIKFLLFNPDSDILEKINTIYINSKPYYVEAINRSHGNMILKLIAYNSPEEIKELSNNIFYIDRSLFQALGNDEFYLIDLIGYKVLTEDGLTLGKVKNIITNGAQDIMEIEPGHEMIVVQSPFFISFDKVSKTCIVRIPEYI